METQHQPARAVARTFIEPRSTNALYRHLLGALPGGRPAPIATEACFLRSQSRRTVPNRMLKQMSDHVPPGEPARVLIVEDEALVAMMLADLVEEVGFDVSGTATSLNEALKICEDERPDIAIVDVTLKGERAGIHLGAEMSRRYGVCLIFISGHGDVGEWPEVQALAPTAVLKKPCPPDEFIRALEEAAREKKRRRAGSS